MKSAMIQRLIVILLVAVFISPAATWAVLTFTQLDDDVFIISHRVKIIGSRGKATKMVYTKAASLCIAAGYSYFKILDQESQAAQQYEAANASIRVRFYLKDDEEDDDRIGCERNADPDYVAQARKKLQKMNYEPPTKEEEKSSEPEEGDSKTGEDQVP